MTGRRGRASLSGPALAAASGLAGKGIQFVALTGLALLVSPAEFGLFSLLQATVFGVASLSSSAFAMSAAASTARRRTITSDAAGGAADDTALAAFDRAVRGRRRWLAVVALADGLVVSVGISVVYGHPEHAVTAFVIGVAAGGVTVVETFVGVLAGSGRPVATAVVDGSRGLVSGVLAALGGWSAGAVGAGVGLVALDAVIAVVVLAAIARRGPRQRRGVPSDPVVVDAGPIGDRRTTLTGLAAASSGQVGPWVLLWGLQAVGGLEAVATFAVANRFAALVLLVPVYLGKNLVGRLVIDPATGRSALRADVFVGLVGSVCLGAAVIAGVVQWAALGSLADRYPGVVPAGVVLLIAAVIRGVATALSMVCAARGHLRVWLVSDLVATAVSVVLCLVAVTTSAPGDALVWLMTSVPVGALVCALIRGARLARPTGLL
jgi:O-antigen/teichoic acid export membrane protein